MQVFLIVWVLCWIFLYSTVEEVPAPTIQSECDFTGDDDPQHYCCDECATLYVHDR